MSHASDLPANQGISVDQMALKHMDTGLTQGLPDSAKQFLNLQVPHTCALVTAILTVTTFI